ncbi:MAG: M48 family metalloprotease [Planctomycetaceae bacterium]|nr:M48 family metalloprotease [Planctomycetaceae bacterium]
MLWFDRSALISTSWLEILWPFLWQSTLLIATIGSALILFRSLSPEWRHRVWLLVAAKLLILPCWFWTLTWQSIPAQSPELAMTSPPETAIPETTNPEPSITVNTPAKNNLDESSLSPIITAPQPPTSFLPDTPERIAPLRPAPQPVTKKFDLNNHPSSPIHPPGYNLPPEKSIADRKPTPLTDQELLEEQPLAHEPLAPPLIAEVAPTTTEPASDSPPATSEIIVPTPDVAAHKVTAASLPPKSAPTPTWTQRWQASANWLFLYRAPLLFTLWLVGLTIGVARWLIHWIRLRYLLAQSVPPTTDLQSESDRVASEFGLRYKPRLVVTQTSCSPFVCGGLRPTIVLPASIIPHLESGELRRILLHELAHLKRRDLWWNWLPELCVVLYWFHPLVYWLRQQAYSETELSCDRLAMQVGNVSPGDYADTLVRIVTHIAESNKQFPLTIVAPMVARIVGSASADQW